VGLTFEDLPQDIVAVTKLRVLDVIGLALAGAETDFGRSVREAALAISAPGPCRILGFPDRVGVTAAAFANGALSQALEFDDTHNESIVHMSSPAVAAALALSEFTAVSGRDLITAIAIGNEISCRVGSVSSGELHKRGFHPTGLFATFGAAYLAGKLLGLDTAALARAAGIAGSFAGGLLECWVDGTQTKFLHPGWSAQSGITAALLARSGVTGPAQVFEGRWGLFASHVQDPNAHRDFFRINDRLGEHWESRNSSFKPFPAAHVIHPYISVVLRLRATGSPPSQRINGPNGARNRLSLPIQTRFRSKAKPAISVYGRSQLLVCGTAMKTDLRASAGNRPRVFQPASRRKAIEAARSNGLSSGVLKRVRCMDGSASGPRDDACSPRGIVPDVRRSVVRHPSPRSCSPDCSCCWRRRSSRGSSR